MNKLVYNTISAALAIAVAGGLYAYWPDLLGLGNKLAPSSPRVAAWMAVVIIVFFFVVLHAILSDILAPAKKPEEKMTEAEKRAAAEKRAQEALKDGHRKLAMDTYEQAGFFPQAAQIAQDLGDSIALVRICKKMGHFSRARKLCLELGDFEGAAFASTLMGEVEVARDYFKQEAESRAETGQPKDLAALWDRSGDWAKASKLYEEAGEHERAAECYDLLGDKVNARRCMDHARAFRAFEQRKGLVDRESAAYRGEQATLAQQSEANGDFFGAGLYYREANQTMESALAFERFEEWERAARAYEKVGLQDRAGIARTHIKAQPQLVTGEMDPTMMGAPLPAMAAPVRFEPLTQIQYVPVYGATVKSVVSTPENQEKVAQRVRRGEFLEAARYAQDGGDWLMAAALFERAGEMLKAADLYRQIGKTNDASWCLEKASRPRDGALLALASGDEDGAIKILSQSLEGTRNNENGLLLGSLLIKRGAHDEALNLLRKKLAPGPVDEGNAPAYYRFARLFEEAGAVREALSLYRTLLESGAHSDDIAQREAALARRVASEPARQEGEAESGTFSGRRSAPTSPSIPAAKPGPTFEFAPPPDCNVGEGESLVGKMLGDVSSKAPREISLFGRPDTADAQAASAGVSAGQGDPFSGAARYRLDREVARGGMGVIYEALDTALDRRVALKLILSVEAGPDDFKQFLLEARAVARITHPNVVTLYDIGLMDMKHYITMELIRGGTLTDLVAVEKRLTIGEAVRIFIEVARGLHIAHEQGIVHRDIKPGNILLNERRLVKIVDFGLAKLHKGAEGAEEATMFVGSGTPGYMAPEQIRGEESLPRADIYALGVMLFTMLIGEPPHKHAGRSGPMKILAYQLDGDLPSIRKARGEVPEYIEQLYRYCTALDPEERYQSVDAFLPSVEEWYQSVVVRDSAPNLQAV
ncbi:MAG: protein kinase [Candidatus Sumerlaeaceae bacterium]|nr:protein kinase [Candidatus Sumerlaeaceae bacterium]